jgi:hypothetical protein
MLKRALALLLGMTRIAAWLRDYRKGQENNNVWSEATDNVNI